MMAQCGKQLQLCDFIYYQKMNSSKSPMLRGIQPLGMGLEARVRGRRHLNILNEDIYTSSIFGECGINNITTTNRTLGLSPLTTSGDFIDYPTTATQWQVSSTSINDTALGTGARTVSLVGLDENWDPISETVTLDGQTGVITTLNWFRINKLWILSTGSSFHNEGTIFVTSAADTLASGIPVTTTFTSVLPEFSAMSVFTYSIRRGYNFEYVIGNFFTDFTPTKNGIFQEYYRDESSGSLITSFSNLFNSGNVTYDYRDAVGWYDKVTIEGRVQSNAQTNSGTVFYEFALVKQ